LARGKGLYALAAASVAVAPAAAGIGARLTEQGRLGHNYAGERCSSGVRGGAAVQGRGGMRLPRYLAACGAASRRHAEGDWITVGRVRVNGEVERNPARTVGPGDVVCVDGVPLRPAPRVTIMLHKPAGVVVSMADPRGRTTVRDLLPPDLGRLYPVGRLDADSEGLLLMTSDGDLAQAVLHPRHGVVRRYLAERFGLHSLQQTTPEFLEAIRRSSQLSVEKQTLLTELFARCDLAKFARTGTSSEECRRAAELARQFVRQTTSSV